MSASIDLPAGTPSRSREIGASGRRGPAFGHRERAVLPGVAMSPADRAFPWPAARSAAEIEEDGNRVVGDQGRYTIPGSDWAGASSWDTVTMV